DCLLADRTAINDRLQLRQNCFLVRGSKNPDANLTVAEIQNRRKTSNPVPEPEIRTAIELNARDLQKIELVGNFLQGSVQHHGRKAPSGGKLDQNRLTGFQNFVLEVRFVDINGRFHAHRACNFSNRVRDRGRAAVASPPYSRTESGRGVAPGATRRSRRLDSHHWARSIPDVE